VASEYNPEVIEDGRAFDDVGRWCETKHKLVSLYASLFSTAMKGKWGKLAYVELYAGSGHSKIRGTTRFLAGSPLRALQLKNVFDKYIFCERSPEKLAALRHRTKVVAPRADVAFIHGDCNERVGDILAEIPKATRTSTVLSLCFVDPYNIGSMKFDTIRKLSDRYIDFLVLLALFMDANRNYDRYVREDSRQVDEFIGSSNWRDRWKEAQPEATTFPKFLAKEYARSMETLGYIAPASYEMKIVRSDEKNLPLYLLALFSRKALAYELWGEVLKYSTDQGQFWG
jgi:three-Cys-motif partner protein